MATEKMPWSELRAGMVFRDTMGSILTAVEVVQPTAINGTVKVIWLVARQDGRVYHDTVRPFPDDDMFRWCWRIH